MADQIGGTPLQSSITPNQPAQNQTPVQPSDTKPVAVTAAAAAVPTQQTSEDKAEAPKTETRSEPVPRHCQNCGASETDPDVTACPICATELTTGKRLSNLIVTPRSAEEAKKKQEPSGDTQK